MFILRQKMRMMKRVMLLVLSVVFLACNGSDSGEQAPELPELLQKAIGKKWRYAKKLTNGRRFIEVIYHEEFLEINVNELEAKWDTFYFDIQTDTLITYSYNEEGQIQRTPDIQKITRVTPSSMDVQIYSPQADFLYEFDLVETYETVEEEVEE